ncbi:MAG: flagellar biosynthetic protein FliO [Burkholderiales bacterium]|nr:flagellar biosynthetic protein FliO [Burkholderiales bacterium]
MKYGFALAAVPFPVFAAQAAPIQPVSGMLQMFLGLVLVLAMLIAAAWLVKRFSVQSKIPGGAIRVIAGAAVGQRERVVLIEVGETWLLVGVAPGHVSALHTMRKVEIATDESPQQEKGFPSWLRQVMEKRNVRS